MSPLKKPMLAYTIEDTAKLTYPLLVSPKLDGIRATVQGGVVLSRSLKPIRSKLVQELFGKPEYEGFDGELLYGEPTAEDVFNLSTQAVMSTELPEGFKPELLKFCVFDYMSSGVAYNRGLMLRTRAEGLSQIETVSEEEVLSEQHLLQLEQRCLNAGYEGVMCKSPNGLYKLGRSTARAGELGKLKRFTDEEATVIGFEELMRNQNEAIPNALGRSERSTAKDGLVGAGTLGSLLVESPKWGTFSIGSGLNDIVRAEIWDNQQSYLGQLVKFKYFPVGVVDKPRFPVFLGFRDESDM